MQIKDLLNLAWFVFVLYLGYTSATWLVTDTLGFMVLCLLGLGVLFGAATGNLPDNWYMTDKPKKHKKHSYDSDRRPAYQRGR